MYRRLAHFLSTMPPWRVFADGAIAGAAVGAGWEVLGGSFGPGGEPVGSAAGARRQTTT